jgi:hypothetical protein
MTPREQACGRGNGVDGQRTGVKPSQKPKSCDMGRHARIEMRENGVDRRRTRIKRFPSDGAHSMRLAMRKTS